MQRKRIRTYTYITWQCGTTRDCTRKLANLSCPKWALDYFDVVARSPGWRAKYLWATEYLCLNYYYGEYIYVMVWTSHYRRKLVDSWTSVHDHIALCLFLWFIIAFSKMRKRAQTRLQSILTATSAGVYSEKPYEFLEDKTESCVCVLDWPWMSSLYCWLSRFDIL